MMITDGSLKSFRGFSEELQIDTSEVQPVYLLAGKNDSYIRLSSSAYHLLRLHTLGSSAEEIAGKLSRQMGRDITAEDVDVAYQHVLSCIARIEKNSHPPQPGFLFRLSLIPKRWVAMIAARLSIVFHPIIAACLIVFAAILIPITLLQNALPNLTLDNFWLGYALLLVSTLAHEFGHASACVHYGAQPGDIGFTTYLIYPAFYSNVSTAWELKRWQRVIVDAGGMFFQLVVGAVYATVYTFSGWQPLLVALFMILGSCAFSLNPIFHFDGYWMVTDALGVTNLSRQPRRILSHMRDRLLGRSYSPLPWSMPVKILLLTYVLLSFGFWGYFVWKIIPMMGYRIFSYPGLVITLVNDLLEPSHTISVDRLGALLMSTYMVLITLLMVWRLGKPALKAAKNVFLHISRRITKC